MKRYDLVVIGGGPAGITLAKILGRRLSVAVVRPEDFSMVYCAMPYVIEGVLPMEKTFKKDELVLDAGADLIRSAAASIDYDARRIELENGEALGYEKLVLATGAVPFIPPVPGADLSGVLGFKTEADMRTIHALVERGAGHAVVVGAGAIGIELAQALARKGLAVHLVDQCDSVLPNLVDAEMAADAQQELDESGVKLHLGVRVSGLAGGAWVEEVELESGEAIRFERAPGRGAEEPAGLVVFATGMRPVVDLARQGGLEIGPDGIVVDDRMRTSRSEVYAVGDCIQFRSGITGRILSGKLATNAVPMAKILAFNLLGQDRSYSGYYNGAATKVGRFFLGGTGLTERAARDAGFDVITGSSEVTSKFPIMPGAEPVTLKLVADRGTRRLIGAQIVAREPVTDKIDLLTFAMQKKTEIAELTTLSYAAQPYQSYFPAANLVVMAAEKILAQLEGRA